METTEIFTQALNLPEPWYVEKVEFEQCSGGKRELIISIDFKKGWRFAIGDSEGRVAHDTVERTWRHLNFFEHECYIKARVPRIKTGEHSIEQVTVPWARPGSGFTMLFEAYAMLLIEKEMPVSDVAETMTVTAPRIWRVFTWWIMQAIGNIDLSGLRRVGVDETSYKKGHKYITQFVDLDTRRTIFVTDGKGSDVFGLFVEFLIQHGGQPGNIQLVSMDMSSPFILGCRNCLPAAEIVFDHFHVVKLCNEALDEVRKGLRATHPFSSHERYTLLSRNENIDIAQQFVLADITEGCQDVGMAYLLKESFADLYSVKSPDAAEGYLAFWCDQALDSGLKPFRKMVDTIRRHWDGIVAFFRHNVSNGILEGINSKIQLAKRRARGFSNIDNFIHMVYLIAGKLDVSYPH